MQKDKWDKAKDIAQIVSLIAIPVVIAVFGWLIQSTVKNQEIRRDYVQMAVHILAQEQLSEDGKEMRQWAMRLLDENSPTRFSKTESNALVTGRASVSSVQIGYPQLPAFLAEPCEPVRRFETGSFDELSQAYIDLLTLYAQCSIKNRAIVTVWPK